MGTLIGSIKNKTVTGWQVPTIFDSADSGDWDALQKLIKSGEVAEAHDEIRLALDELFDIENPAQKDTKTEAQLTEFAHDAGGGNLDRYGCWVYYPWDKRLVHFPPRDDLRKLRTSRNRNLVTTAEQAQLYASTICVLGMSVGSNVVEALVSGGIGGRLVLADMDHLEPSNLNRIRAPYHHVGLHKVDAIARKISEIDPFIEQVHYRSGLNDEALAEIVATHKPDVFVDEMDDVRMKLKLRIAAKAAKLPVIMAADDGDDILVYVERHDLETDAPLMQGLVPDEVIDRILTGAPMSRTELGFVIGKFIIGFENVPLRMLESLFEVGKSLPSWPQLGGAAAFSGISMAYAAKRIITKAPLNSGRHHISLDEPLNPEIKTKAYVDKLSGIINKFSS